MKTHEYEPRKLAWRETWNFGTDVKRGDRGDRTRGPGFLNLAEANTRVGAPLFAQFAKGGYYECRQYRIVTSHSSRHPNPETKFSSPVEKRTRPCRIPLR